MCCATNMTLRLPMDGHYVFFMNAYELDGQVYVRPQDLAAAVNGSPMTYNTEQTDDGFCLILHTPYCFKGNELSPRQPRETKIEKKQVIVRCGTDTLAWNGCQAEGEFYVEFSQLADYVGVTSHRGFRGWSIATWDDQHVVVPGVVKFGDFSTIRPTPFGAVPCFDDFWFVGDASVGCFVLRYTNDAGEQKLVMIDALSWQWEFDDILCPAFRERGLRLEDVTDILITHEHFDHWGVSRYMQTTYGTKIHWTKAGEADAHASWQYWNENGLNNDGRLLEPPTCDAELCDGAVLHFGRYAIQCIHTPGHSDYCYSFIVNVTGHGNEHLWCVWGGTGMPAPRFGGPSPMLSDRVADPDARHERMLRDYAASAQKLRRLCAEQHVDCMLSNHPYCDYSYRILPAVEQARARGENPLLRGEETVQEFLYGVYAEAMITLG